MVRISEVDRQPSWRGLSLASICRPGSVVAFRFVASGDPAKLTKTVCSVMKLTTQQAAERLGKSRTAVWRAIKNGRLSAERTDAKDFLIDSAELERYASTLAAPMVTPNEAAQQTVTSAEPNRTMEDRIE